ncbi:hypothetical protein B0H17DRAFT_1051159 [Mycena rosella]|uniref:Uncharacterized protein n=1 Tax=Mycena rosella TaxID=1033263 RepID=A0AAD7DSN7_MYCRO|nr:hypothetical protein B0H17DRAFT_1051159 [Mycena rosella]
MRALASAGAGGAFVSRLSAICVVPLLASSRASCACSRVRALPMSGLDMGVVSGGRGRAGVEGRGVRGVDGPEAGARGIDAEDGGDVRLATGGRGHGAPVEGCRGEGLEHAEQREEREDDGGHYV